MHLAEIFQLPFAIPFWVIFFFAFVREGRVIRSSFTSAPSAQDRGTSVAILFLVHCYLYGIRVAVEERALRETVGEAYLAYGARTKRFIPFII